jgi:hypothetical protein
MNPRAQDVPDMYVWEVPGKPVVVHITLTVIDRLLAELMRGYGANPKRSPEIGGVLIGGVQPGSPTVVRIDDFETVPCEYRRGPSYVFTEEDCGPFEQVGARPDAIGYFRSHTREGLSLATEDVELLDHFFPDPFTVALLIRPYATKPSVAGFFIREGGKFPASTPKEFPFRRQELTGEAPAPRRSMMERRPRGSPRPRREDRDGDPAIGRPTEMSSGRAEGDVVPSLPPSERLPQNEPTYPAAGRRAWSWLPLAFVFLIVGVALGFQAALMRFSDPATNFTLSLVITKNGQTLSVRWDQKSPAVRASRRGVLEIEEMGVSKPVQLDAAQLQNGMLTYRNTTNDVHFRLVVFPRDQLAVLESAEWRQ